jgi:LacI family transcriptional regulator
VLSLPHRPTLVSQAVQILKQEILNGHWSEWLPSERELSGELRISRPTLRLALEQLHREGALQVFHGVGHRLCGGTVSRFPDGERFAIDLICPDPLAHLPSQSVLWIDELRLLLSKKRCELRFHHGARFLRKNVGAALDRVVSQNQSDCWLLCHSNERIQRWFVERISTNRGLAAIVAGNLSEGSRLPSVAIDYEAACVHGVGMLIRAGHRKIVYFRMQSDRPGDVRSELAVVRAARNARQSGVQLRTVTYRRSTVEEIVSALRRVPLKSGHITAMLVDFPSTYLTVATVLPTFGLAIPRDVSVICRQYDRLFEQLVPRPVSYTFSAREFAAKLYRMISDHRFSPTDAKLDYVIPRFLSGDSVAPPR